MAHLIASWACSGEAEAGKTHPAEADCPSARQVAAGERTGTAQPWLSELLLNQNGVMSGHASFVQYAVPCGKQAHTECKQPAPTSSWAQFPQPKWLVRYFGSEVLSSHLCTLYSICACRST